MARHMFFGGNTPQGFYSNFSSILFLDEAEKIIHLKGSSGSGKSTLMRKTAKAFENKGYDVDYIHCSNNVKDLDGICIRDLGIAMIDATAPHTCDPAIPMGIDEIFNTADFISRKYIESRKEELLKFQKEKKQYYDKAYNYLNGAYKIYLNNSYIYRQAANTAELYRIIEEETEQFGDMDIPERPGRNRKMFISAVTPQGFTDYSSTIARGKKTVLIKGADGMGTERLLESIMESANIRGFDTEGGYCALNRDKLEHLLIPELNLFYTTVNKYHGIKDEDGRVINFFDFANMKLLEEKLDELDYNSKIFDELMNRGMNMMAQQKQIHDKIEKIYVSSMNFEGLNNASEALIKRLLDTIIAADCEA